MAGIFEEVQMREDAYASNPQGLQQRYAQSQQLVDLLALQQVSNAQQAAKNQITAAMETNPSTRKEQLEQEVLSGARSEVMAELAPGLQQRGRQTQQIAARQATGMPMGGGLPTQPANNMMRAAQGGIVGYAEGGMPEQGASSLGPNSEEAQRKRYMQLKAAEAQAISTNNMEMLRNVQRELANYEGSTAAQPPKPTPENTFDMAGGGIVSLAAGGTFPDLNKDGEVTQADILMGRGVAGKQEGGIVGYAPGGGPIGANNPFNIRDYNQDWQGQSGATRGFVDFEDEFSGVRAADKLLSNYGTQEGIDTLRGAISRFAPPNENLTEDYISFVSEQTGIPSEQPIDLGNERTRRSILSAMGRMESGKNIDVVGMLADDESRFGVTTDSGLSPEQARTQDETEEAIDAAFLRRTGRERPKTSLLEGLKALLPKGPEYIVDSSGYIVPNPSLGRSGEELAETMRDYKAQIADIKEDIPGLSVSDRAVLAGQELIGRKNTSPEETEEVEETTVEEIINTPPPPPVKTGLSGANIDFDLLRQMGAAAASGTTTGQSLALAGAATGAEQARREQVSEKRRSDDARNAVLEQQIQATIGAQTGRTRLAILEAFDSYKQPINRARRDKDIAAILNVEVNKLSKQPAELIRQAELRADREFLEQLQGLAGSSIGNAVSAGGLPEGVIVTRRD